MCGNLPMAADQGLLIVGDSECGCLISLCVSVNAYFSGDRENHAQRQSGFPLFSSILANRRVRREGTAGRLFIHLLLMMIKDMQTRICPETAALILERAQGNYREILQYAGVSEKVLHKPNQECPWCGGEDRFSFTDKFRKGDSYCRHCGHHSGVDLLMLIRNFSYKEALLYIADFFSIPVEEYRAVRRRKPIQRTRDSVERLWSSSRPIEEGDGAYLYLRSRGILGKLPPALRSIKSMRYSQQAENGQDWESSYFEGLIAEISDMHGKRVNLHRTYLEGGRKADVKTVKKVLSKELSGCSIRLGEYQPDGVLGLAEGIETALSASELFKVPVWSVIAAFNFKQFVPPEGVRKVILFADADLNFVGQREAYCAAAVLKQRYPALEVEVRLPDFPGWDWNDVLMHRRAQKAS